MKLLLVSHGNLAEGMCDVLVNFFALGDLHAASVSLEGGVDGFKQDVNEFLATCADGEQVVICSDLLGGSPNQNVMPLVQRPNTWLVTGMNLALVMQLAMCDGDVDRNQLEQIVDKSREAIVIANDLTFGMDEDDE